MPVATCVFWFGLVWLLGWIAWPAARLIWNRQSSSTSSVLHLDWPDCGLAAGRIVLLSLWALLMFWAGHWNLPTRLGWILLLPFLLGSAYLAWRDRETLLLDLKANRSGLLWSESTFFVVFLLFLGLRGFWPDINNGEKTMDLALISACARADFLPPPNPYLAESRLGGYYYLGHLQTALLTKTIGAEPRWTYNLMCATLPALCFSIGFALCATLAGSKKRGLLAIVLVLTLGTLQPLRQWFAPENGVAAWPFGPGPLNYFSTSRVIPNPVNPTSGVNYAISEYPWFTFSYADLHAHYFAMPLALLLLSLGVAFFARGEAEPLWLMLAGLLLSALTVTNTWDVPVYFGFLLLCLWPSKYFRGVAAGVFDERHQKRTQFVLWALAVVVLLFTELIVTRPYTLRLHTNAFPPSPLDQPASPLRSWLLVWAIFVGAWLLNLALPAWRQFREQRVFPRGALWLLLPLVLWLILRLAPAQAWVWHWPRPAPLDTSVIYTSGRDYSVLLLILTLTIWTAREAFCAADARRMLLCRMALCGFLALLWSETTWAGFLKRELQGPTFHRQDTVFKFGLQAWFLLGIAATCSALSRFSVSQSTLMAVQNAQTFTTKYFEWPRAWRWSFVPLLLIAWSSSLMTTLVRARHFKHFQGWDAWSHLQPAEREAAQWLQTQAQDGDNLIEAEKLKRSDYSPFTRYAHVSGIPAVVGPAGHTFQWGQGRKNRDAMWQEVQRRKRDVRTFYTEDDLAVQHALLARYQVRFVVAGELERREYGPSVMAQFDNGWPLPRRFGTTDEAHRVSIWRVEVQDALNTK
jgi:YYY domain-containing protein